MAEAEPAKGDERQGEQGRGRGDDDDEGKEESSLDFLTLLFFEAFNDARDALIGSPRTPLKSRGRREAPRWGERARRVARMMMMARKSVDFCERKIEESLQFLW